MKKIIILYYFTARNTEAAETTIRSCALENFVLQSRGLCEGGDDPIVYAGRAVSGGPPARPSHTTAAGSCARPPEVRIRRAPKTTFKYDTIARSTI